MECPYCGSEHEGRHGRDLCVASHFSGEKCLPKPSRTRFKFENLLDDWIMEVKN